MLCDVYYILENHAELPYLMSEKILEELKDKVEKYKELEKIAENLYDEIPEINEFEKLLINL